MRCRRDSLVALVWLVALGCGAPGLDSPEAAFERLRVAVASQDARLVYDTLDKDSQDALASIWSFRRQVADLLDRYPPDARARALARVQGAREAATPRDFFVVWLAGQGLPPGSTGTLVRVERTGATARVATSDGQWIDLAEAGGRWGFAGLRLPLARARDAAANDLSRTQEDVALYAGQPR